ncbi:DUF1294 domain-containing protein [Devosia faecipullorum]|uniref:DUF1294 domain-containing protein n=1 Tax=Devosia faecipullorum TaxID=2755039 RepID=UPI00187BC2A5|nr:DUF1294 domain-containing protein [Devosia faecipullorum]MBE7733501.1 DUF1294 domain-containing protein [Devosia faecipullorum]
MRDDRLSGELLDWNDARGFGFVRGSDEQRYFVHISDIGRIANRPRNGDRVSFTPGRGRDGRPVAKSVAILGANPRAFTQSPRRNAPGHRFGLEWRWPLLWLLMGALGVGIALNRLPWQASWPYLVFGLLSLVLYRLDKGFALAGRWRISEATLLGVDLCFGIMGGLSGQSLWRHKTRKPLYVATTLLIAGVHLLWLGTLALDLIRLDDLMGLVSLSGG